MSRVCQVTLLVNRTAGTGRDVRMCEAMASALSDVLDGARVELAVVENHPSARERARTIIQDGLGPAAVLVSGGGGTLRAVVEGICDGQPCGKLPGAEEVRLGVLRMGSGNAVARRLGMPKDPGAAIRCFAENLCQDRTVPVAVMRCEVGSGASAKKFHAVTMGGFGQFGRVPGDLLSWHRRWPRLRRAAAHCLGLEPLNTAEYATCVAARCAIALVRGARCESIEVRQRDSVASFRLLAGALISFPISGIPFRPRTQPGPLALSLYLISRGGGMRQYTVTPDAPVEIRLVDRPRTEFFVDEDPEVFEEQITIRVAGTLCFVPGGEVLDQ
jgi:hypothetical protein